MSIVIPSLRAAVAVPGWAKNVLWRRARAVPSLDLRFADNKSLTDAATGQNLVTFTRASSGTFVGSDGVLQTAATDVPRFDHNPRTGESLGLLVEEQRTNSVLRSEEFDNAVWNPPATSIATVTPNAQIAPNGTLTADTFTTVSGTPALFQAVACLASTTYTWSFYVKLGTMAAADFRFAVRDDSNGVFIAQDIAPSITPVTTEWRRVTYTFTTPVGCVLVRPYPYRFVPATYGTTVFLWGAQLEAGAFPTSYIPTTTAAVTRSADVASITGANFSSWYRQDEGTVFAETQLPFGSAVNTSSRTAIDITDGSTNNRVNLRAIGGATTADQLTVRSGASTAAQFSSNGSAVSTTFRRLACAVKVDDFASWATGATTAATDTSGAMPVALNQTTIGSSVAGTEVLCGTIRRLTFWPQRLSNSTLQTITQ